MKSFEGGRLLGRGKHGSTYTVARQHDPETIVQLLEEMRVQGRADEIVMCCKKNSSSGRGPDNNKPTYKKHLHSSKDVNELLAFLKDAKKTGSFIGKRFIDNTAAERKEAFDDEARAMLEIADAFGSRVHHSTTLGVPKYKGHNLYGLHIIPAQEYFIFSQRCGPPLDKYRFNDRSVRQFVLDILRGFSIVHGAGIVHGDVKLDNMIFCKNDRTFKIIDWGLAEHLAKLRARYMGHKKPKNYGSPMSWYVWGLWRRMSWATYLGYYLFKWSPKVMECSEFRTFLMSAGRSFDDLMATNGDGDKKGNSNRAKLLQRYACSFDLFNFGVILASLATCTDNPHERNGSSSFKQSTRAALLNLATRLTHYGAPDFIDNADEALRCWAKVETSRKKAST
jgi:serine/threonine protein kinase